MSVNRSRPSQRLERQVGAVAAERRQHDRAIAGDAELSPRIRGVAGRSARDERDVADASRHRLEPAVQRQTQRARRRAVGAADCRDDIRRQPIERRIDAVDPVPGEVADRPPRARRRGRRRRTPAAECRRPRASAPRPRIISASTATRRSKFAKNRAAARAVCSSSRRRLSSCAMPVSVSRSCTSTDGPAIEWNSQRGTAARTTMRASGRWVRIARISSIARAA